MGEKVRVGAGRCGRGWAGGWREEACTELPGANQSEGRGWALPRGAPRVCVSGGVVPQMLLGVGWGPGCCVARVLTFFSSGAKGRGPRVRHVFFRAPVCLSVLSVVGFCFQGGGAWMASHYPPLPGLLLYLGDLSGFWFGWGPGRMWGIQ